MSVRPKLGFGIVLIVLATTMVTACKSTDWMSWGCQRESSELAAAEVPTGWVRVPVVKLERVCLTRGTSTFLEGKFTAKSRSGILQVAQIRCAMGGRVYRSTNSTVDIQGPESGASALRARWMFTPPATGFYECALVGAAHHETNPEGRRLAVIGGGRSWLRVRDGNGGTEWRDSEDFRPRLRPDDPASRQREDEAKVLAQRWKPRPGARAVDVMAGVELSRESTGGSAPFTAKVTLYAIQLDSRGNVCTTSPRSSASETRVLEPMHHLKVDLTIDDLPIDRSHPCVADFRLHVLVDYLPDPNHPNPIRHGGLVEGGGYTNLIAMST